MAKPMGGGGGSAYSPAAGVLRACVQSLQHRPREPPGTGLAAGKRRPDICGQPDQLLVRIDALPLLCGQGLSDRYRIPTNPMTEIQDAAAAGCRIRSKDRSGIVSGGRLAGQRPQF